MQDMQSLQDLLSNLFGVALSHAFVRFNVFAEVAVLDVLHREKHCAFVFIPAEKFDKQVLVLHDELVQWVAKRI